MGVNVNLIQDEGIWVIIIWHTTSVDKLRALKLPSLLSCEPFRGIVLRRLVSLIDEYSLGRMIGASMLLCDFQVRGFQRAIILGEEFSRGQSISGVTGSWVKS